MSKTLHLNTRYYRALPIDAPGYEEERCELPLEKIALVGMHCWNVGCPDGPTEDMNFCIGMGWPQATAEAYRIMIKVIRPAMDAARACGMTVCHVESDWMSEQYPEVPNRRCKELPPLHGQHRVISDIVSPRGDEPLVFYSD